MSFLAKTFTFALVLLGLSASLHATSSNAETAVILVRHAEKAGSEGDPDLSPAGKERALELARAVKDIRFNAIFATPTRRTRQTAEPAANRLALPVTLLELGTDHSKRVADEIRKREGETLLVVGHSNTVPEIIRAIGGPAVRISDSDYDNLFVCTLRRGEAARCVQLHYGRASQ